MDEGSFGSRLIVATRLCSVLLNNGSRKVTKTTRYEVRTSSPKWVAGEIFRLSCKGFAAAETEIYVSGESSKPYSLYKTPSRALRTDRDLPLGTL